MESRRELVLFQTYRPALVLEDAGALAHVVQDWLDGKHKEQKAQEIFTEESKSHS